MALTKSQIDLIYQEVLARHASAAEQDAFSALSSSVPVADIQRVIVSLPEARDIVDPVIRLYQGAFGRLPDTIEPNGDFDTGPQSGFWVNVNAVRNGITLLGLAKAFVVSPEFHDLFGSTIVTPALITAFYERILARDPSSSEVGAWAATGLDAASILLGFTQSVEFMERSRDPIDEFKLDLANGLHPSGPLPPPPPEYTLDSDADLIAGVDEGGSVSFTVQAPISRAGQTFSYIIRGLNADDVVGGQITGTVTLDQHAIGHLVVTLAEDRLTEGREVFNIEFPGLPGLDLNVVVNDTSVTYTGAAPLVFNAGNAGSSTLDFSNVDDSDIVTLGDGDNSAILGNGDDVYKAGTGDNTVNGGLGQDDMTVALDTDDSDTFVYTATGDSLFSLPDIITGFTTGDFLSLTGVAAFDAFNFAVVTSDAAVAGALATLEGASAGSDHVVYNSTTGHVYFDIDSSGTLNALAGQEDMEITLVGLPNLTAGQILT